MIRKPTEYDKVINETLRETIKNMKGGQQKMMFGLNKSRSTDLLSKIDQEMPVKRKEVLKKGVQKMAYQTKKEEEKDKLVVELIQHDNVVVARIVHQDESLRGNSNIYSSTQLKITSGDYAEISESYLCVRGRTKTKDNNYFCYNFDTIEKASAYMIKAKESIRALNESLKEKTVSVEELATKVLAQIMEELKKSGIVVK